MHTNDTWQTYAQEYIVGYHECQHVTLAINMLNKSFPLHTERKTIIASVQCATLNVTM